METTMNTQAAETETKEKRSIGGIIVNVILVLAILFGIFVSYTAFTTETGSGTASFFGIMPFSIQSDSMAPTFEQGDLVLSTTVDAADLEVGDVITFWTVINGERVRNTHRITEIQDMGNYLYFNTKGDNNSIEDSLGVHQSEIIGKYIAHIPSLGAVIDFLQTSTGFLVAIVVPVFLFFIYNTVAFFKALFAYQAEKMRLQIINEQAEKEKEKVENKEEPAKVEPEEKQDEKVIQEEPEEVEEVAEEEVTEEVTTEEVVAEEEETEEVEEEVVEEQDEKAE